jgi:hypothetical protein
MRYKRIVLAAICAAALSASLGLAGLAPASAAAAAHTGGVARSVPLAKSTLRAAKPALGARPDFTEGAEYYISTYNSDGVEFWINSGATGAQMYINKNVAQVMTVDSTAKVVDGHGFYMWTVGNNDCWEFNYSGRDVRTAACDSSVTSQWWWLDGTISGGGTFYSLYGYESGVYYTVYTDGIANNVGLLCNNIGRTDTWYFG